MKTLYRYGLPPLFALCLPLSGICQQGPVDGVRYSVGANSVTITLPSQPQDKGETVTLSGPATTAHIADPNERLVFNGRVMRMADFVAAFSSSNVAAPRPHNQEMRSHEISPPTPPSPPKD